jgi:hypothetical protein
MAERNKNTEDGVITVKYELIVAFARRTWKLQSSIGRFVQICPISEAQLATIHRTTHANTAH